jgi:hypothetical protein
MAGVTFEGALVHMATWVSVSNFLFCEERPNAGVLATATARGCPPHCVFAQEGPVKESGPHNRFSPVVLPSDPRQLLTFI